MSTPWKLAHAKATEAHHEAIRRIVLEASRYPKVCGICGETVPHRALEAKVLDVG